MRSLTKVISSLLSVVMASALFVSCGESGSDGAVTVDFWYSASISENKIIREMVEAYNNGQGKEDGVLSNLITVKISIVRVCLWTRPMFWSSKTKLSKHGQLKICF